MTLRHHVDVKTSSALPYMADHAKVYWCVSLDIDYILALNIASKIKKFFILQSFNDTKWLPTFESLDELLVLRGQLRGHLESLPRDVEHRLALHLPPSVRQGGEELV